MDLKFNDEGCLPQRIYELTGCEEIFMYVHGKIAAVTAVLLSLSLCSCGSPAQPQPGTSAVVSETTPAKTETAPANTEVGAVTLPCLQRRGLCHFQKPCLCFSLMEFGDNRLHRLPRKRVFHGDPGVFRPGRPLVGKRTLLDEQFYGLTLLQHSRSFLEEILRCQGQKVK